MTEIRSEPSPSSAPLNSPGALDWGRGYYEQTADALAGAAQTVVMAGRLRPGERVLDVGCGTGNVALIAARAGAHVTGVDPAPRLLDVARDLAHGEGLGVDFLRGDAGSLPLMEASVDVVLSNFGVIFARDPMAAAAEMVRVLVPGGRIAFSAWLPGGTIGEMNATAMKLVRSAVGAPLPPPPFAWHEQTELTRLFDGYDLSLAIEQHELAFTAKSPAEYLDLVRRTHPLAVAAFEALERAGQDEMAHDQLLRILENGNEDDTAFRSTSRYVVVTATGRQT